MADEYSSSDSEEMETEIVDGGGRDERLKEKADRRKLTPYKFSGKSYSFDLE